MNTLYLALLFTLSLSSVSCQGYGNFANQYAGDFISKYAGGFMGGGGQNAAPGQPSPTTPPTATTPSTPSTPANTVTPSKPVPATTPSLSEAEGFENSSASSVFSDLACSDAMDKANVAITQLARSVSTAKDTWGIYGYAQKLSKTGETLNSECETTNLKLVNLGKTGVNRTQDLACKKLIQIIESVVISPPTEVGPPADYKTLLAFSQKALDLSKYLGKRCEISIIDKADESLNVSKVSVDEDINSIEDLFADEEEETFGSLSIEEEDLDEVPVGKNTKTGKELDGVMIQVVDSKGKIGNIYTLRGDSKKKDF